MRKLVIDAGKDKKQLCHSSFRELRFVFYVRALSLSQLIMTFLLVRQFKMIRTLLNVVHGQ